MYVFIVLVSVAFGVLVKTLNADVIVYTQFSNQVSKWRECESIIVWMNGVYVRSGHVWEL